MADHVLERRVWLARPRPEVFELFLDPAHRSLVQVGSRFGWRAGPPARIDAGALLDFRVCVGGLPARWRVMVRELDPPHRLMEAALWGPFARWEHRCRLSAAPETAGGPAGTWVEDALAYRFAAGIAGELWHAMGAGRSLARAFDARARRLVDWSRARPPAR